MKLKGKHILYIIILVILAIIIYRECYKKKSKEGYRDPIYMNRFKLYQDWYPRTNGTIYGPCSNIFSGYAYYDTAI